MGRTVLDDFSGGLNLSDSINSLEPNETPDSLNWTLTERGALAVRGGCDNFFTTLPGDAGKKAYIFYSEALDKWLCVREASGLMQLYWHGPSFEIGAWTLVGSVGSPTGSPTCNFVDWPGLSPNVIFHLNNSTMQTNIYRYDGTTLAALGGSTQSFRALALWQNKIFVVIHPVKIAWCVTGDPQAWNAFGNFVEIRDKDAEALTGLGVVGGAMLAFKRRSAYRVNSAETGAYTTLDPGAGCVHPRALISSQSVLYTWGADGVYVWDGIGAGVNIGGKLKGDFASEPVCAGALEDPPRILFKKTTHIYEFGNGAITKHKLASTSSDDVDSFSSRAGALYGAVSDANEIFGFYVDPPGRDNGVAYEATYRTPWTQPENGRLARLNRLELQAWIDVLATTHTLKLRVYKDFDRSSYEEYDVSAGVRGGDSADEQEVVVLQSLGHSRAFAFDFYATTVSSEGETIVRSLTLHTVPLER